MPANRPIGHIAGHLTAAAVNIANRVRHDASHAVHLLWITDDGCLWLQPTTHVSARAIVRTAPQLIINRYQRAEGFGWRLVHEDLVEARADFATRSITEAAA